MQSVDVVGIYLQKVAVFHHSRSVKCIYSSSKSNNQIIIIKHKITISIKIGSDSWTTMDNLFACINFETLSLIKCNILIFLKKKEQRSPVSALLHIQCISDRDAKLKLLKGILR
jgi:hypothetical protein